MRIFCRAMGPEMPQARDSTSRVGLKLPFSFTNLSSFDPNARKENMARPVMSSASPLPIAAPVTPMSRPYMKM